MGFGMRIECDHIVTAGILYVISNKNPTLFG